MFPFVDKHLEITFLTSQHIEYWAENTPNCISHTRIRPIQHNISITSCYC